MHAAEVKPIKGFSNYMVTSDGEIYNVKTGKNLKSEAYVSLLKADGTVVNKRRAWWVATHFIPNPDNLLYVQHIDENYWNFKVENLKWATKRYK